MTLYVSQSLTIPNPAVRGWSYLTISTIEKGSFSECSDTGEMEWWPWGFGESPGQLAIHDSAKDLWKGETVVEEGVLLGLVYKPKKLSAV